MAYIIQPFGMDVEFEVMMRGAGMSRHLKNPGKKQSRKKWE